MSGRVAMCLASIALVASPARAEYENSPHVIGDNAEVSVVYDQRVNHTNTVEKKIVVYRGPRLAEVRAEIEQLMRSQTAVLSELLRNGDEAAVLEQLDARINAAFATQPEILSALTQTRGQLDELGDTAATIKDNTDALLEDTEFIKDHVADEGPREGFVSLSFGYMHAAGDRPAANGGFARAEIYMFLLGDAALRHLLGLGAALDWIGRTELTHAPDGEVLESADRDAYHLWGQFGYEMWIFPLFALRAGLALGTQSFETGRGDDWRVSFGAVLGTELRFGWGDRGGFRVGVEWAPTNMTSPEFHFEGFQPSTEPERSWQHLFRFYIAFQLGFGRAPHSSL